MSTISNSIAAFNNVSAIVYANVIGTVTKVIDIVINIAVSVIALVTVVNVAIIAVISTVVTASIITVICIVIAIMVTIDIAVAVCLVTTPIVVVIVTVCEGDILKIIVDRIFVTGSLLLWLCLLLLHLVLPIGIHNYH